MVRKRLDRLEKQLDEMELGTDWKPWALLDKVNPTDQELADFEAEHPDCRIAIVRGEDPPEDARFV